MGWALSIVVGLFLFSSAAFAQQGVQPLLGTYDMSKSLTKTGTITDLTWSNPHCVLFFDAKNDDGTAVNWAIELSNPRTMIQMGATPPILMAGKQVTVTFNPATNASNRGLVRLVKMGDTVVFDAFKNAADLYDKPAPQRQRRRNNSAVGRLGLIGYYPSEVIARKIQLGAHQLRQAEGGRERASPPMATVCQAPFHGEIPVKRLLMNPNTASAASVMPTE